MKYSRSAITQLTRWYRQVLIKCAILNAAIIAGTFGAPAVAEATEINQSGVPFQTSTTIENNNPHIWNISTTTTNGAGTVGLNTFGKFNVSEGDTANLILINQQDKLVNLVFDSSASQIDGIVNSYKNGQIGGNVLFANPNGFVVGKTGVFNVGSLTLMTPTESTMKKLFDSNAVSEDNLNSLVSFNMKGEEYLLLDNSSALELNPAEISVDGTINSGAGITIINGGSEINIKEDAKLNANMNFSVSGNNVTATKKDNITPTSVTKTTKELDDGTKEVSLEYKLAMDGGNGVVIVSKNTKVNDDYLAAIVNMNGKIDANKSDVLVQTEIFNTGIKSAGEYNKDNKHDVALSKVTVGGDISGNDVALNARVEATSVNNKFLSYGSENEWLDWLGPEELNFLISDFFHMADMKASVEVLNGANINADGNLSLNANTSFVASTNSIFENLAFNYTDVDIITESILRSGSNIKAQNLNVLATTDMRLTTSAKATNIAEVTADVIEKSFGHGGAYAITVALSDIENKAIIEKAVILEVAKNILVDAEMYRTYNGTTKNGLIPIVDKNFGTAGIGVGVFVGNTVNKATMESDADIAGTLGVEANLIEATNNTVLATAEAKGESSQAGIMGKIFMFFKDKWTYKSSGDIGSRSYTRANGSFDNIKVAATVGVSVDNIENTARIGNKEQNIKPVIKASSINLKSKLTDYKSNLYASSTSANGETSTSGAVAVNVKNLDSGATAYGDFTIKDTGYFEYVGQKADDYVLLDDGTKLSVNKGEKVTQNYNAYIYTADEETTKDGKTYITLPNGKEIEGHKGDKVIIPTVGMKIEADTIIKHGLSYGDWLPDLFDWIGNLFDGISSKVSSPEVKSINTANANEYLSATTRADDIQKKIDDAGNLNILNAIDFSVLGAAQLFNTFAASSATAAAKDQATKAYSGAFAIAVHNTVAKAILEDNSSVLFKGAQKAESNTLDISAYTNGQLWSGAAMMGILNNITSGLGGASARDGDSAGGALSFQWGTADTISNIGENVTVSQENSAVAGDVIVEALDETDDINVAIANGSADESGLAGAISISAIDAGKVEAAIKSSNADNAINGKDVKATAKKDLTHINANVGVTMAQDAKGIGIAVNYADDEAVSYIAGNVNALNDVDVRADYDKLFVNGAINVGFTKTGTDAPRYQDISDEQRQMNLDQAEQLLDKAQEIKDSDKWYNFGTFRSLWNARNASEAIANSDYDFSRAINTDKETSGKAGMVSVSISDAMTKAYIADGAKISAGRDVNVKATSEDMMINGAIAMAINGKSGMGGTLIGQWTENEVEAYIGNATIDALRNVNVDAEEELKLFAGSVGVVQGKDTATAGNISVDIQNNKVTAAIKDGAKINTLTDNADQSVKVKAGVDTTIIKGVGSVGVQAGGSGNGAKGGTLDGDVALNEINAYIKNAEVNAGKEINVEAGNETDLITVDVAGAVSTANSSYAGTLGAYVSINEENAYIEGTQINTAEGRINKNADVNIVSSGSFDDLAIVGTVAYGDGTSADASIRVDGIGDEINSYIKDSNIDTTGNITLDNDSVYDSLAVTAAGAISKGTNAISGAVAIAVNSAIQKSYIEGSTVKASALTMDSDAKYNALGITGVIAANLTGQSIGGSVYLSVIDNDIDTYVKNSNLTAQNDINMTSDTYVDSLSIIFAGSGGKGMAASGAISTIVNSADVNTYILSENGDKKVVSENGKVAIKSTNDINIDTINAAASISIGNDALGASINTVVDSSDTTAGIEGTDVKAEDNVDVSAKSEEKIMSISVGGAGGSGITAAGSFNTVVMASDTDAYIKDAIIKAENVNVNSLGTTEITGGAGALSISMSSLSIGASVVTGVIDNEVTAVIENSKVEADNDVTVSAEADETIGKSDAPFITIAGGFSKDVALEGVVDTMIMSSTADAHIKGKKTVDNTEYGVQAGKDVSITAEGKDTIFAIGGSVSASAQTGVGATINTIVIDKDVDAYAENTKITAGHDIKAQAKETDDFFTTVVAASGAGSVGVAGVVNTNVITSELTSGFKNSELKAGNKISSKAEAKADMQTITGAASGGGSVGVGLSAVNDIIKYTAESYATGVNAEFKELDVTASADSTYQFTTVSGAGGGSVGGAGVENVNYVNNTIKAYADGILTGKDGATADKANVSASDTVTFNYPIAGVIAVGGTAGIGGTVMVNSVTSAVEAYLGGSNVKVKDIDVSATGKQSFNNIVAAGFAGGGTGAFSGTVLVNDIDTTIKSHIMANSNVTADDIDVKADNKVSLIAFTGAGAVGGTGAFGASVNVNDFEADTEAYTGSNVTMNAKNINISAETQTNLGEKNNKLIVVAGSAGLYAGIAGSVMWNNIENKTVAYIGSGNTVTLADNGKLDLNAKDTTNIYESLGAGGAGLAGIGASVGGNEIENTILAFIGSGSVINGSNADVTISAESVENVDALGVIVGAGGGALAGGAVYTSVGKKVDNASYNDIDNEEKKTFTGAKSQSGDMNAKADEKNQAGDNSYKSAYNGALDRIGDKADGTRIADMEKVDESLYTKTATSSIPSTNRDGTTSAFIDSGSSLNVKGLKVNAKNSNDISLETDGVAVGLAAVGVSVAIAENETTTNAFVSNGVTINADSAEINANSTDKQHVETLAAQGGIIAGGGSTARIYSDKTTNSYVLDDTAINTNGNLNIKAQSSSDITSYAKSGSFGGVVIGASKGVATETGSTRIDLGSDVSLNSQNGNVFINTNTNDKAIAKAWAASGGVGSGAGAVAEAKTGKNNTVNIGKNFSTDIKGELNISSTAKNDSYTESNGRAYGGVSGSGANGTSTITQTSGVNIADADAQENPDAKKKIKAGSINISSKADNKAKTDIYAGAGAIAGFSGSTAQINISSNNNNYIGKNYDVETTEGSYSLKADTINEYKGYDKSDSYGVVVGAIPSVRNVINSTVSVDSETDIVADKAIAIAASNEIKKAAVSGYDLYGGAGGLASGAGGSINDTLTMNTATKLGGNKARAQGDFGKGSINVSAYNIAGINEKADLYSHGGIAGADTDSIVNLTANATTVIANKDVSNKDDHISYTARNDVDIYTKVNVESYGGIAGAGGRSEATTSSQAANVIFESGAKSVSGRDTNISAISNKSLDAYIYAETGGLISVVKGRADAHNYDSKAYVTINDGAEVKSFDVMNVKAISGTQKLRAKRDALAYELGFIPYHGSGNEYTTNNNLSGIIINGELASGLGADRNLIINKDGTTVSENDNIRVSKEQVGEITSSDLDADIDIYEQSKENATKEYNDFKETQEMLISGYTISKSNAEQVKASTEAENKKYSDGIEMLEFVKEYNPDSSNLEEFLAKYSSSEVKEIVDFVTAVENSDGDGILAALLDIELKLESLPSTSVETLQGYIATNNTTIANCEAVIATKTADIQAAEDKIAFVTEQYNTQIAELNKSIEKLTKQKEDAADQSIPVYSMIVDDIVIRSGETNLNGIVSGSGSITAPGNKFSITVDNNSVSDVVYGDLIIGRNLKGGIYGTYIATSVNQTLKSADNNYKISITNHVDANDPTINITNGFGDIVLKGNIENVNGSFDLTNYTGNILSEGSMTVKDLHIKAPNGAYSQVYVNAEMKIGGNSGDGSIIAAGDIDIAAKTINVNGLIQSGTEIKTVTVPDFSVIKENGKYYQIVGDVKTEMKPSEITDGYYYLTLSNDTSDLASIQQIKAYFRPTDSDATENVPGEIFLFKAGIDAGNITLTGNIINDKNTGKIVMIDGYGHIDITNNSNYNLVTNALNADNEMHGKLTINDFKLSSGDDATFDILSQADLTEEYLTEHSGTYTAQVDENGNIATTADNITEGNGSWEDYSSYVRDDGAVVYSTTYTPGNDAYMMTKAGEIKSYVVYVKRSWWTELWYGKQYETRYYYEAPIYEVKNNPIAVNFQGFSSPVINIASNGSGNVVMNNSISAMGGSVNITSGGSILTRNSKHVISAKDITLTAENNIGELLDGGVFNPIQIAVYDNGKLKTTAGDNIYINFPYTDISNMELKAGNNGDNYIYLATSTGNFNGTGKEISIKADSLELHADSINLNTTDDTVDIEINKLKARAENGIKIVNKNDLVLWSIVSENKDTIHIESVEGSILAASSTGTYSDYHINGGDVVLKALKGSIGSATQALEFANNGTFNVEAKDDIYLDSATTMYVDKIQSNEGGLFLTSTFGIIASAISEENRNYHLSALGDIILYSAAGNIENIAIDSSSGIYAVVGYENTSLGGLSSINIRSVSDDDMKLGMIMATQNVTLTSNKGIKNTISAAGVTGENIILKATDNIGEQDSAIRLSANRAVTALTGGNKDVYLTTNYEKGMQINRIDTNNGEGSLRNVEISSAGNIINNSEQDGDKIVTNIKAENIKLNAKGKNIGSADRYFVVETTSKNGNKGLSYDAENVYIKGVGNRLNIIDGKTTYTADIETDNAEISIQNITSVDSVNIQTSEKITINNANISQDLAAIAKNVTISEMKLDGNFWAMADNLSVNTSDDLNLGGIIGNTSTYANNVEIVSAKDIINGASTDDTNIFAQNIDLTAGGSIAENQALNINLAEGNTINMKASDTINLNNVGAAANYDKVMANKAVINSDNDVNIADLDVNELDLTTKSANINITGNVETKGEIKTADKRIVIDNESFDPDFDATAQLHLTQKPMHLIVDVSNNIRTESQNVTRHNLNTTVNKEGYETSMEGEVTLSAESGNKNSYHGETIANDAENTVNNMPSLSDYVSNVSKVNDDMDYLKGLSGAPLDETNIMNIINQNKTDDADGEKYSEEEKKEKIL